MDFNRLVSLLGEEFKKSPKHKRIVDLPMFSIYVKEDDKAAFIKTLNSSLSIEDFEKVFADARTTILKMGFSAMHTNVLFKDLTSMVNDNTGGGTGGYASKNGKFMAIDINNMKNTAFMVKLIVHEWAHLWMFNNSSGFKKAIRQFYNKLLGSGKSSYADAKPVDRYGSDIYQDIINRHVTNDLYTEFTTQFSKIISNAYTNALTWKNPAVDEYFREQSKENRDGSILYDVSYMITKVLELYNSKTTLPEQHISPKENKDTLDKLKKSIADSIINKDGIFNYIDKAINMDEEDFIGDENYGKVLTDDEKAEMYNNMYIRTKHNKHILRMGGKDSYYDVIYPIVFDSYPGDAHAYFVQIAEQIHNILEKQKHTMEKERLQSAPDLSGEHFNDVRDKITDLVKWVNSYGMSNNFELWATGIEDFVKLPPRYKKEIMNLMQQQDRRELPNRTMRKKMK